MLNPDSRISFVIFQHETFHTIDDVVVEYDNGTNQICYQVKHEIATSKPNNLTFGKLLEKETNGTCLFEALFSGWKRASSEVKTEIKPILYTNRKILDRRAGRTCNGTKYSAYPVDKFLSLVQDVLKMSKIIQILLYKTLTCYTNGRSFAQYLRLKRKTFRRLSIF